ncbi:MAG: hypothetical protein NTU62_11945 [Spirochaetes bacterium]|nr:hypothetical protein [Spirochaetota bacterium]
MAAARFEVVPAGVLSTAYDVLADGLPKGRIEHRVLSMRDQALISTPDRAFTARREKVFRSTCVLESPEGLLRAKAEKERFWREEYRVQFDSTTLLLRQKPWSLKGMFLISDPSGEIGCIVRERLFTRRLVVEIAAGATEPPFEIVEFLVWIVLMVQRRHAAEASG